MKELAEFSKKYGVKVIYSNFLCVVIKFIICEFFLSNVHVYNVI